jgi:hypothetical protein
MESRKFILARRCTVYVSVFLSIVIALPVLATTHNVSAAGIMGSVSMNKDWYNRGDTISISVMGYNVGYDGYFKFYLKDSSGAQKLYKTYDSQDFSVTETYAIQSKDRTGYWISYIYWYELVTRKNTLLGTDYAGVVTSSTADDDGDGLSNSQEINSYHTNPFVADTDGDGLGDGAEVNTYHTNPLGFARWAVIVCGGTVGGNQQEDFDGESAEAYRVLLGRGYTADHIDFLSPHSSWDANGDGINDVDALATTQNVQTAIQTWLAGKVAYDSRVFIYLVDHGTTDILVVSNGNVGAANFGTWLGSVNCYRVTFVIEACMSGSWQDNIAAGNRIFISSAAAAQYAWPDPGTDWPAFSHTFFTLLGQGLSIDGTSGAFWQAHDHANAVTNPDQDPQMSDQISGDWWP